MTISSNNNRMDYTGDGATTVYAYSFKIFNASELVLTKLVSGVESTLILNTDYTVSGVGEDTGGDVTLTVALANTIPLVVRRVIPVVQETDIKNQSAFFPEIHEDVFDKLVMMLQQHDEELGRGVSLAVSSIGVSAELPAAEAYKVLGWNAGGTAIINLDTPSTVQPIADTIHAATNKTTPVDADEFGIWDSVSGLLNKLSFANLKTALAAACSAGWNAATATLATNATNAVNQSGGTIAATTGSFSGLVSVNSGQIKFPAAQNLSSDPNTLDDYEEGSFSIGVQAGGSTTNYSAYYVKVGGLTTYTTQDNAVMQCTASGAIWCYRNFPYSLASGAYVGICCAVNNAPAITKQMSSAANIMNVYGVDGNPNFPTTGTANFQPISFSIAHPNN